VLFIFDEPTTGLHFDDIAKLLKCFDALVEAGHSLLVIEHNMDVVKCADFVVDLGPDAGEKGGEIVVTGTPEKIVQNGNSYTGRFLKKHL
jgi:excinuclease ABC subunit A